MTLVTEPGDRRAHSPATEAGTKARDDETQDTGLLFTNLGPIRGDVVNLIRTQRCGSIVQRAGLATATGGRFAPGDVLSHASTVAPRVHVMGDSSATTQPTTNSASFSTITADQAAWLKVVLQYDPLTRTMVLAPGSSAASAGWSEDNFRHLMADTFA